MGVGDIVDETIRLYRHNFRTFVGIVAVLQVPLIVLQMIQLAIAGPNIFDFSSLARGDGIQPGPLIFWLASSFALAIVGGLAYLVIQAALTSATSERYLGRQITVGQAYRTARGCFWRLLGNTLIIAIVAFLLFVTIIGIPVAIFLLVRWMLVVEAIALEGKGVFQSLSRSTALVKGSWWRVLGVFIVALVLQYMVAAIPAGILSLVVMGVGALVSPTSILIPTMINTVIGSVFGIVATPLIPLISVLLYYDLRIRKEGFDLQLLAEQPGQGQI